jgi:NADH-quinone oxidoreductase subunit N
LPPFLLAQEAAGRLSMDKMPDLWRLAPEIVLCAMVLVVLLIDVIRGRDSGSSMLWPRITILGIVAAGILVVWGETRDVPPARIGYDAFGALQADHLAAIFKLIFLATGALTVLFIGRSKQAYGRESELSMLMFGALAGMCYLAGATDLLGFYLAFETVSYTGYLMAGYRTDSLKSAEAGGKYVIFGSVSSAVMLFGLSLVYGYTGSMEFSKIAAALHEAPREPVLLVAAALVFGGFAFKAAAFPFQFWCPDVYEGAPAPIAGFLAVASKAAVFAVILRVLWVHGAVDAAAPGITDLFASNGTFVQQILVLAAVGSMTWGNLAALRQTNVQRMLAYSSIAHAGYLLMTAAVLTPGNSDAMGAIVFYFVIYLCMNLGAFYVVTLLRRDAGSAEMSALRGAGFRQPFLAVCFAIMLFSLTGLPPTAGFIGKFQLFAPLLSEGWYVLAAVGLLNGAISLYYYAKPLREMFLTQPADHEATRLAPGAADLALLGLLTAPLVILGLFGWGTITEFARSVGPVAGTVR